MSGKMYIRDISLEQFVNAVLESDAELAKKIRAAEIEPNEILTSDVKEELARYSAPTGLSLGRGKLRDALTEKMSVTTKGLIVGMRDRFGINSPIRIPILKSDGSHIEATYFGFAIKKGNQKIEFSFPAIVTARVLEGEYKGRPNYKLLSLDSFESITPEKALTMLNKVAKTVDKVYSEDEGTVVVLRGRISFIEPSPIFKDQVRVGEHAILAENGKDVPQKHPVLQISLNSEGGNNRVRVTFDRNKMAMPTIAVDDMMELISEAVSRAPDNPREQAAFVGQGLNGREVIAVGYVGKYRTIQNSNYIEVGGCAIFDTPGSLNQNWFGVGTPAKEKAPEDDFGAGETQVEPPEEKKEEKKEKKEEKSQNATLDALSGIKVKDADTLRVWLKNYCLLIGEKPSNIPPGFVKNLTKTDLPESVIKEVLAEMK